MIQGLIGKNLGMTSIFLENGINVACTVIKVNTCCVIQIKNIHKDGYDAVQLGVDDIKKKHISKTLLGHFKKHGIYPKNKLMEFKILNKKQIKIGQLFDVNLFKVGNLVHVRSVSKGKGFQGVVKRHNFSGVGERSHGQHNRLRSPGSIGAGSSPSRVFKGKKMAGRMGNKYVTVKNLKILDIDIKNKFLILQGSIPGNKNSYIMINKKI